MVSCVSQVSVALSAALGFLCWHGWACAHEGKLEADGGRVNGMRWVLEEEEEENEGKEAVHWLC